MAGTIENPLNTSELMRTVSMTFKIEEEQVLNFENWIRQNIEVIDFKILPETEELYENDPHFKKLVKQVKEAQKVRDHYINEKNFKPQ